MESSQEPPQKPSRKKRLLRIFLMIVVIALPFIAFYLGTLFARGVNESIETQVFEKEEPSEKWSIYKDSASSMQFIYPNELKKESDTKYFHFGDTVAFRLEDGVTVPLRTLIVSAPIETNLSVNEWIEEEFTILPIGYQFDLGEYEIFVNSHGTPIATGIACKQSCYYYAAVKDDGSLYVIQYFVHDRDGGQDNIFQKIIASIRFDSDELEWRTYQSGVYDYEIDFPKGSQVVKSTVYDFPGEKSQQDILLNQYSDQICVKINHGSGTVFVSAPINKGLVDCEPRNVQGDAFTETFMIDGEMYRASGLRDYEKGNIDVYANESISVVLGDGTKIGMVSDPDRPIREYMRVRDELIQAIESYKAL